MSLRNYIRNWLGINETMTQLREIRTDLNSTSYDCHTIRAQGKDALSQIALHNHALARIIAKLDPMYAQSEFSPERRADSDRIAKEVLNKLHSKAKISGQYK